jgi:DNA-binding CsgD family transcriptional regulator
MNYAYAITEAPRVETKGISIDALMYALRRMDSAESPEQLRDVLLESLLPFGFKGFTIAIGRRHRTLSLYTAVMSTWPKGTNERYVSSNLINLDPVMQRSRDSAEAFVWDMSIYDPAKPGYSQLARIRRELGMNGGIVVPMMESMGGHTILYISGSAFPSCDNTVLMLRVMLQHLMGCLNQLRHVGSPREMPINYGHEAGLSAREREALGWVALGKSSRDVSTIMGISEYTVNEHINNAMTKLNASNRTDAAVRALMLDDIRIAD